MDNNSPRPSSPPPLPASIPPPLPSSPSPPPLPPHEASTVPSITAEYVTRNSALTKRCRWVLDGAVLREEPEGQRPQAWPLVDVVEVNLQFAPTRVDRNCHRCRLRMRDGRKFDLLNRTYAGPYQFQDTSAEFVAFIGALHVALAARSPGCAFTTGTTPVKYALNLMISIFTGLILIAAGWYFVIVGFVGVAAVKMLLILFYLPILWKWFKRNKPSRYQPHELPSAALPAAK